MLMAVATATEEPTPVFGFAFPPRAEASNNLLGKFSPTGKRRPEIAQRLTSYGITGNEFAEYCTNTRFNRQYFRSLSVMLASWDTFRIEEVNFAALISDGSTVQIVKSVPMNSQG